MSFNNNYILVINCGSSSLKWSLYDIKNQEHAIKGIIEAIGTDKIDAKYNICQTDRSVPISITSGIEHIDAFKSIKIVLDQLQISLTNIIGVGHRVVHGGDEFFKATIINDKILTTIDHFSLLAPLHNPANTMGIELAQELLPNILHVAVFDTAFHQTLEPAEYLYPIDYKLYEKYKLRKYGFHGTSHQYVAEKYSKFIDKPICELNLITAHLGNGCSLCAIRNGKSAETSMGLTPLAGVMMGTRSGNIDPGIFDFLDRIANLSIGEINGILNKNSGLLGISGEAFDLRIINKLAENGHQRANLALEMFSKNIAQEILKLTLFTPKIDGLLFTGGIGENDEKMRKKIISYLNHINMHIDPNKNIRKPDTIYKISTETSVPIFKISTDEEAQIAKETLLLIKDNRDSYE